MGTTANYGWVYPSDGGNADTWGAILNALFVAQDASLKAVAVQAQSAAPTGAVMDFLMTAAPAGWVVLDGATIGDGASGATGRANDDTAALFAVLWANFDNGLLAIQNADGTAGTRGGSAVADYAAHKRLPLVDQRDRFRRSFKSGGGSAAIGVAQADAFKSHSHSFAKNHSSSGRGDSDDINNLPPYGAGAGSVTTDATGDSETRPANIAYLTCIKL